MDLENCLGLENNLTVTQPHCQSVWKGTSIYNLSHCKAVCYITLKDSVIKRHVIRRFKIISVFYAFL